MKKIVCLLFLVLSASALADEPQGSGFGIDGGLNFNNFNVSSSTITKQRASSDFGLKQIIA